MGVGAYRWALLKVVKDFESRCDDMEKCVDLREVGRSKGGRVPVQEAAEKEAISGLLFSFLEHAPDPTLHGWSGQQALYHNNPLL
ncbi:unnamed protein product [Allacma fusca]|uniref:Uncharacterized protein n=1 Tax=Allacma fusca TaxID=39272 RepID=A0A8J2JY55_9HEXA|nr:unnamed protein product [Allacma fusca]